MAIDAEQWWSEWVRVCRRFGREAEPREAADYMAYLDDAGMSTWTALAALHTAWATREFFPRPADLLGPEAALGWTRLLAMAGRPQAQYTGDSFRAARETVPDRAWAALMQIGGLDAIRNSHDLAKTRADYLRVFEANVQEAAYSAALDPARAVRLLSPADRRRIV
jgi:hypothetical protein